MIYSGKFSRWMFLFHVAVHPSCYFISEALRASSGGRFSPCKATFSVGKWMLVAFTRLYFAGVRCLLFCSEDLNVVMHISVLFAD